MSRFAFRALVWVAAAVVSGAALAADATPPVRVDPGHDPHCGVVRPPPRPPTVTRPAPPFRQRWPQVVVVEPVWVTPQVVAAPVDPPAPAPMTASDFPFYCAVDGTGFTDRLVFFEHLYAMHDVAHGNAMRACSLPDGRHLVYSGH
jgi:hypothetical protein